MRRVPDPEKLKTHVDRLLEAEDWSALESYWNDLWPALMRPARVTTEQEHVGSIPHEVILRRMLVRLANHYCDRLLDLRDNGDSLDEQQVMARQALDRLAAQGIALARTMGWHDARQLLSYDVAQLYEKLGDEAEAERHYQSACVFGTDEWTASLALQSLGIRFLA